MSKVQLHIALSQLDAWAIENNRKPSEKYHDIQNYINTIEICPPRQLTKQLRRLIVDEGVDPDDIVMWIIDAQTNEQYNYNLRLAEIFKLVYTPIEVDKSILNGLI